MTQKKMRAAWGRAEAHLPVAELTHVQDGCAVVIVVVVDGGGGGDGCRGQSLRG